ncbi:MAG: tRNA (adenosine(37)-N6)-threonylcarbamoyltransferase complex dimerization subunit type 1 TsaB [Tatlockia sp.]|nr:tRNA (adenosine(37)-N6)-threonylcarbamoyltransferase complex dimerization subunit type 1 TsaB [Tatlockia sp.]
MNLLAIDTSTELASIALSINGEILRKEQGAQRSHARVLLPMIEELIAEAQTGLGQLDAIVFGQGPGSFTGLRIACSIAKGLAYANDLPLYPVSSLAAIANEAMFTQNDFQNTNLIALLDARMNQLYWGCLYGTSNEVIEQVSAPGDIHLDLNQGPFILAGVGYETYLAHFSKDLLAKISNHLVIYPKAEAMIRMVLAGAIEKISAADALPVYIRNQITQGEPRG